MADIDLIPVDYREWLFRRRLLVRFAAALTATCGVLLIAAFLLQRSVDQLESEVARLRSNNAVSQQQQDQLQYLTEQKTEYQRRWSLLRGLRAGAAIDDIFMLIDRSIPSGELWFLDWSFSRAGVVVNGEQRGMETGYFVILDDVGKSSGPDLSVETHMTIHGQAVDHQALSRFVRALFEEPDIEDVNVQKTSRGRYANGQVVDFNITVVLNSSLKEA